MTSSQGRRETASNDPVAIVGMAGIYPKAPDKEAFWRNILDRRDCVTDAPEDWCGDLFFDPDGSDNDTVYTRRGGFLGDLARFDPLRHGVVPSSVDGGEPDQFLALEVAADALDDAGFDQRPVPGDRVAVILGRGTYINRGFTTVIQHGVMIERFLAILKALHPETTEADLARLKAALKASLPPFNAAMAPALVPNLVAGRIANRLDFRGTNYILDAACASSLLALERGVGELRAGRCDLALVGGVHASTPAPIYQIFCQLEALSRSGRIRPFDAASDGTLLAEGVGLLCLKRLADAEAAGDRIYALVRGVGVASDGKGSGILAPRLEGETLALRRAYDEAGVDPATVGLVEAHGTGTDVGDSTEVAALSELFASADTGSGSHAHCGFGTVKANIGHCLPASGSAGLIKAALALHHRVLPPTLIDTPNPGLGLEGTPLYLNTEARPWVHGGPEPRRAGVNAFGFGGINAHAVLEEYTGATEPAANVTRETEMMVLDAATGDALAARVAEVVTGLDGGEWADVARRVSRDAGDGPWRAAVVARDAEDARAKLVRLGGQLAEGKGRLRDRNGVYLASAPLGQDGKVAFMFPGEGSQHRGMLRELVLHYPAMRQWFDLVDAAFFDHPRGVLPSRVIFPAAEPAEGAIWRMDLGAEAVFAADQAVATLYDTIGLRPDMLVGHSTGEYAALHSAGIARSSDPHRLRAEIRALNDLYVEMADEGRIAPGTLIAVGAVDGDALDDRLAAREDAFLAMDNCPNQKVVAAFDAGAAAWVEAVAADLGGFAEVLPFGRAYHSPAFAAFAERMEGLLATLPLDAPKVPVYSCLTAAPFPDTPAGIRHLMAGQWAGRVRFAETIRRMHADGARIFVECGPRNTLAPFVDDTLRGMPHLAVAVDTAGRTGLAQLHHVAAQLAVEGVKLDLDALAAPLRRTPVISATARPLRMGLQPMELDAATLADLRAEATGLAGRQAGAAVAIGSEAPGSGFAGGASPVPVAATVPGPVVADAMATTTADAGTAGSDPVIAAYFDTMRKFAATERAVMETYLGCTPGGSMPDGRHDRARAPVRAAAGEPAAGAGTGTRFALLDDIVRTSEGRRLTARVHFSLDATPFLRDHRFGHEITRRDPGLSSLPVVPLTFSMEALAEAAAALRPDLVVVGMREVRASRWLSLERGVLDVEVSAEARESDGRTIIRTRLRDAEGPTLRPVLAEADIELAPAMPPAPAAPAMTHAGARHGGWDIERIYGEIMFHGPRLQAVDSLSLSAGNGAEGTIRGMDATGFLARTSAPVFETDAVTLDAVGQLVGVWAADRLPEMFHIFPFRVERLEIFASPLGAGERALCRARIALEGADEIRSDIEVVRDDGTLQCRLTGWWDKRFDLPERFFRARLQPAAHAVSRPLEPGIPGVTVACLDDLADDFLEGSGGIWARVLAGLVLGADERETWRGLERAVPTRRHDWLRGRTAAKDAVRLLRGAGEYPAEIRIGQDEAGAPFLPADLPGGRGAPPRVSISHTRGIALAAAADAALYDGVGIDVVAIEPREDAFLETAFAHAERAVLSAAADHGARSALAAWMWCAKEAAAKAHGLGLSDLDRFVVRGGTASGDHMEVVDSASGAVFQMHPIREVGPGLAAGMVLRPVAADLQQHDEVWRGDRIR